MFCQLINPFLQKHSHYKHPPPHHTNIPSLHSTPHTHPLLPLKNPSSEEKEESERQHKDEDAKAEDSHNKLHKITTYYKCHTLLKYKQT